MIFLVCNILVRYIKFAKEFTINRKYVTSQKLEKEKPNLTGLEIILGWQEVSKAHR